MLKKKRKGIGNQGFSLVELMISIIILAIVMVPLLNNFIKSAKMNKKMEQLRSIEVAGHNLIESLKNTSIDSILQQFSDESVTGVQNFKLIPLYDGSTNYADQVLRLGYIGDNKAEDPNGDYQFAIHNLKIAGNEYDVVIHINSTVYTDVSEGVQKAFNKYDLPIINQLDPKAIAMVDTMMQVSGVSCDAYAITELIRKHEEYRNEIMSRNSQKADSYNRLVAKAKDKGLPTDTIPLASMETVPNSFSESELKSNTSKEIHITLENCGVDKYRAVVNAIYTVNSSKKINNETFDQKFQVNLLDQIYNQPINYFYLFYLPTECRDGGQEEKINFLNLQMTATFEDIKTKAYVIRQDLSGSTYTKPYCMVEKDLASASSIEIFSNMKCSNLVDDEMKLSHLSLNGEIEKKKMNDWINEVKVEFFKSDVTNRYTDRVSSISSTRTEN